MQDTYFRLSLLKNETNEGVTKSALHAVRQRAREQRCDNVYQNELRPMGGATGKGSKQQDVYMSVRITDDSFLGFGTPKGKKRDPIAKTPLSVRPSVTRLYLMNRDSQTVEIFTDDVFLLPL
ncbi:hypothetical protein EVAR_17625_1 [Eumeta japonica]|uniref:Uncharacterized protein n=1 Tax=Eumeta variegata TaxID=151549 RepID=A0A4C1URK2_EUMVA|nr:hypothetical protein EVAR_17625_1 [Eumeta japonica]